MLLIDSSNLLFLQPFILGSIIANYHYSAAELCCGRSVQSAVVVCVSVDVHLGKLCLQNETIAKQCVPALARELELSDDASIRNNVVIIMCDLCIRYSIDNCTSYLLLMC